MAVSYTNVQTEATRVFLEGLSSVPDEWRQIVDYRTDDVASLKLAALSGVQDPGLWTDTDLPVPSNETEGQPNAPGAQKTLSYDIYGLMIKLNKYDTKDVPQLASYTANKMGMAVAHKYRSLVYEKLAAAFTTDILGIASATKKVCDTEHETALGGTNYRSNKLSTALDRDALFSAITLGREWKNYQNQFVTLFDGPKILVVAPENEQNALEILNTAYNKGADSGGPGMQINAVAMHDISLIVSPHLTDTDDWFVISGVETPLKYWERSSPMMSVSVDQDSRQTKIAVDFAVDCEWGPTPDGIIGASYTA